MLKRMLRREALARRDALEGREARSAVICTLVERLPAFQAATAIHTFLPIGSEIDTTRIAAAAFAAKKMVAVPVINPDGRMVHSWIDRLDVASFTQGVLGTATPRNIHLALPTQWQIMIVPLLAFDRAGYRLGYGKGYYDALLAGYNGLAVGVAFACQEFPELPRESHDIPLELIVTEAGLVVPRT